MAFPTPKHIAAATGDNVLIEAAGESTVPIIPVKITVNFLEAATIALHFGTLAGGTRIQTIDGEAYQTGTIELETEKSKHRQLADLRVSLGAATANITVWGYRA